MTQYRGIRGHCSSPCSACRMREGKSQLGEGEQLINDNAYARVDTGTADPFQWQGQSCARLCRGYPTALRICCSYPAALSTCRLTDKFSLYADSAPAALPACLT